MYRAFLVKSAASAVAAPRAIEKAFLKCAWAVVALACFNGCVGEQRQVISGTVYVGGVKADTGRLFFVPVEGAKGPRIIAEITDGAYRIESDGGLLAGK